MAGFKEIVTKAVIGKGKKTYTNKYKIKIPEKVDTVLGCWVINHIIKGTNENGIVKINGSFNVNIWYSCDNNTRTNVAIEKIEYEEYVKVNLKEESILTDTSEIIIRSLKNPTCIEVNANDNIVDYTIEKELGIEVIGDTKVRIQVQDDYDDYEIIVDDVSKKDLSNIDEEVKENYIDNKNIKNES